MADTAKPAADEKAVYAVTATNQATGEKWSIHDTKTVCEHDLAAKLDEWGKDANATVEGPIRIDDNT